MIHVDRCEAPDVLVNPRRAALKERERVKAFLADPLNKGKQPNFNVYKHDEVKIALWKLFGGKCAYCECKLGVIYPVEHFRPKSTYYWLASEWTNLLPSCSDCNTLVKLDVFPLEEGSTRAQNPGEEVNEIPLLINPCEEDPLVLLEFHSAADNGEVVIRETPGLPQLALNKVAKSIALYSLNTKPLIDRRRDAMIPIKGAIRRITRNMTRLETTGEQQERQRLTDEIKEDLDFLRPYGKTNEKEFCGMVRQVLRKQPWWRET